MPAARAQRVDENRKGATGCRLRRGARLGLGWAESPTVGDRQSVEKAVGSISCLEHRACIRFACPLCVLFRLRGFRSTPIEAGWKHSSLAHHSLVSVGGSPRLVVCGSYFII